MAQPINLYDGSNSVEEMDQARTEVALAPKDPRVDLGQVSLFATKAQNTSASPEIGSGVRSAGHSCGGLVDPGGDRRSHALQSPVDFAP